MNHLRTCPLRAVALALALGLGASPRPGAALGFEEARHLLARTGFGGTPAEIRALAPLTWEAAVDRLLAGLAKEAVTPPPPGIDDRPDSLLGPGIPVPKLMRQAMRLGRNQLGDQLKAWWWQELVETPSPLTERLVLFWHNHFTSSLQKVKFPELLYAQNLLFRRMGTGSFRALLHAIAQDPAMILYLDNQTNRAGAANENFARELCELFTLGEGRYTETDVKEAARAFTGWHVHKDSGAFWVPPGSHDAGEKTFLGKTGRFDGDDIIEILLAQPRTAEHVVEKLWREFASARPDPAAIAALAADFRKDWQLKPLLRALLTHPAMRDPAERGAKIKSPVTLLVGTVRLLGVPLDDPGLLARAGKRLGQDLFDPPNVKGWPGGKAWVTSATWLTRAELLSKALRGIEAAPVPPEVYALPPREIIAVLAPLAPVEPPPKRATRWDAIRHLVLDPTYQLE